MKTCPYDGFIVVVFFIHIVVFNIRGGGRNESMGSVSTSSGHLVLLGATGLCLDGWLWVWMVDNVLKMAEKVK